MKEAVVALRYARGLARVAAEAGRVREVRDDLEFLNDLLDSGSGVPELLEFLRSPTVARKTKLDLTDAILEKLRVEKLIANFLNVLIVHDRVDILPHIVRAYDAIADELTGEATVTVDSARPLTDSQRAGLEAALEKASGQPVHLLTHVEPALLGGVRIHMRDLLIDATILGRLQRMEPALRGSRSAGF